MNRAINSLDISFVGKEDISKAARVSKSAIETQIVSVCSALFSDHNGDPLKPRQASKEQRDMVRRYIIVMRFSSGELRRSIDEAQSVKAKIEACNAANESDIQAAHASMMEAFVNAPCETMQVEGTISKRKLAKMAGVSASSMTARANKLKRDFPGMSDSEINRMMLKQIDPESCESPSDDKRIAREALSTFTTRLVAEMCDSDGFAGVTAAFQISMKAFCSIIRLEIADYMLESAKLFSSCPEDIIRDCVSKAFARHSVSVISEEALSRLCDVYADCMEKECVSEDDSEVIDRIIAEMADQRGVWETYCKSISSETISVMLEKCGLTEKSRRRQNSYVLAKNFGDNRRIITALESVDPYDDMSMSAAVSKWLSAENDPMSAIPLLKRYSKIVKRRGGSSVLNCSESVSALRSRKSLESWVSMAEEFIPAKCGFLKGKN